MSEFILAIDDQGSLAPTLTAAVSNADLEVKVAKSLLQAKQELVQSTPKLVVSQISFAGDNDAGIRFCRELKQHSALSAIPVLLFDDVVDSDRAKLAGEAGAIGLMESALAPEEVRRRLQTLMPKLFQNSRVVEQTASQPAAPATPAAPVASAVPKAAVVGSAATPEEKFKLAQQLMAKALHNLKTSDLLTIVEREDIPRVLSEITRKVCGIQAEEFGKPLDAGSNGGESRGLASSSEDVEIDLDRAFGLKHR